MESGVPDLPVPPEESRITTENAPEPDAFKPEIAESNVEKEKVTTTQEMERVDEEKASTPAEVTTPEEEEDKEEVEAPPPVYPNYQVSSVAKPKELGHFSLDGVISRGVKFSPDGLCLLTNSEDNRLRLLETPREDAPWTPCLEMKEGELVYDFCWFPKMSSADPSTCCFATTSQYQPIHLWDAYNGSIRATYR